MVNFIYQHKLICILKINTIYKLYNEYKKNVLEYILNNEHQNIPFAFINFTSQHIPSRSIYLVIYYRQVSI